MRGDISAEFIARALNGRRVAVTQTTDTDLPHDKPYATTARKGV
jgi:hypothetical protein